MSKIEYLKKEILKTGYPLEIEISSILDRGWLVFNTDSYFDQDEEKLRDIDIRADKFSSKKLSPLVLSTSLVAECKKSENFAWVFFTRPLDFAFEDISGQYLDELQMRCKSIKPTQLRELLLEKSKLHYEKFERVAVSYDAFPLKSKKSEYEQKKKEIFEAQNQLKKYICYSLEQATKERYEGVYRFEHYFPCIVFHGQMYEATFEGKKMELASKKHILLTTQYRPSYSVWEEGFLIDVVHRTHFRKYLRKVLKDIKSLEGNLAKYQKTLIKRLEEAESLIQPKRV